MTTIILVSIGILLAAVAALFVIFYGGNAFNGGDDKAQAARLVNEGVMIQSAVQAFRAQEDRMPGSGSGVDSKALKELICSKYLTTIPTGIENTEQPSYTKAECDGNVVKTSGSPWKVDYTFGIARSVVGPATDPGGETGKSKAMAICTAARKQLNLPGEVQKCDAGNISSVEPCCVMSKADADA